MKKITLLFSSLVFLGIGVSKAQLTVLHSFNGGENPQGSVILSEGVLYGMTTNGGANNAGYIFSVNTNGSNFKNLWNFNDSGINGNANGSTPRGSLLLFKNKLYGMTYAGGSNH